MNTATATTAQTDFSALLFDEPRPDLLARILPPEVAEAARAGRVVFIDADPPPDRPPLRTDPSAPDYNEAERLPPEWQALVGVAFDDDRITVGSLADILEALPQETRDEWRRLCEEDARADNLDTTVARLDWEEAHGIEWDSYGGHMRDTKTGEYIVEQF